MKNIFTKTFMSFALAFACAGMAKADNELSVVSADFEPGQTVEFQLILTNTENISNKALQVDMTLPEGLTFETVEPQKTFKLTDRVTSVAMWSNNVQKTSGAMRFSMMGATIPAGNTAIATFNVVVGENFVDGSAIKLTNVKVAGQSQDESDIIITDVKVNKSDTIDKMNDNSYDISGKVAKRGKIVIQGGKKYLDKK